MAKNKKPTTAIARRNALDHVKKEKMLAILIRNRDAYETVSEMLQVRQLKTGMGDVYALVWRETCAHFKKYEELPDKGTLMTAMHQAYADNPNLVQGDELGNIDDFVEYAFDDKEHGKNISKRGVHVQVALETCQQFLEEVHTQDVRDSLFRDGEVPIDVIGELEKKKSELEIVKSLTNIELDIPFPEGWDTQDRVQLFTTGTPLDGFFGGGWTSDEVVLFMGPYGSCKSTLVCHACAELITFASEEYKRRVRRYEKKGKDTSKIKRPVIVLIFTEGSKNDYRIRLLSHLARIPWKKLAQMKSIASLSKSKKRGSAPGPAKGQPGLMGTAYEKDEFPEEVDESTGFRSEQTRIKEAVKLANDHLVLIDCTDSDESKFHIGKGGIPEIANIVRAHFRKHRNTKPLCFWIDHASALADRIMEASETGHDDQQMLRKVLKRIPRQCKDKLVKPWKAPVAIMHQLSGQAASRSPTSKQHHTDAAECKAIAEFVDFAVVTGIPDQDQYARFECTKHRREPPTPYKVVRIEGLFNRIADCSDAMEIHNNMFVNKDEAHSGAHEANAKHKAKKDKTGYAHDKNKGMELPP